MKSKKYLTYPKSGHDKEGGLRIRGIVKDDSEEYPLITYITVVYNRVHTLERCIKSVLSQEYENIEYIIVDGASTDGTLEVIEEYQGEIDYYISQPDDGIYNAMNKGISLARGRFLCFMNSDDRCTPDAAEIVIKEFRRTGADIICGTRNLWQKGTKRAEITYPRYRIHHCCFRYIQMYHQSTYASSEIFDRIGGFDEKYSLLADWVWESAAIDADYQIAFISDKLSDFHYDGASLRGIEQRDREWVQWIRSLFPILSKHDAELLLNCLERDRTPLFNAKLLQSVAEKYITDRMFIKAYYETLLLVCIEDIEAIYTDRKAVRYSRAMKRGMPEFDSLKENKKRLKLLLRTSIRSDEKESAQQYKKNIGYLNELHDKYLYQVNLKYYSRRHWKRIMESSRRMTAGIKELGFGAVYLIYHFAGHLMNLCRMKIHNENRKTMRYMEQYYINNRNSWNSFR